MLDRNIIEQVETALKKIKERDEPELKERLYICNLVLGETYSPSPADMQVFERFTVKEIEDFYRKYLYLKSTRSQRGVVLILSRILDALDGQRQRLNLTSEELDRVKAELARQQGQIESFNSLQEEAARLKAQQDAQRKELEGIQKRIRDVSELNTLKQALIGTANKEIAEGEKKFEELRKQFNDGLTDEAVIEIIRFCSGIGLLAKVNLDLFCEYVIDHALCERLKAAALIVTDQQESLQKYEAQLESAFMDYRKCLKEIIEKLPYR